VNFSCSSDLTVQTIRWLNNSDNGTVLFSNLGKQELSLAIEEVKIFLDNTMYTCEVEVLLATEDGDSHEVVTMDVMLRVDCKYQNWNHVCTRCS
jgi:hypothetical protein